jgi:hypothetical protein
MLPENFPSLLRSGSWAELCSHAEERRKFTALGEMAEAIGRLSSRIVADKVARDPRSGSSWAGSIPVFG